MFRKVKPVTKPIEKAIRTIRDAAIWTLTLRWLQISRHDVRLWFYKKRLLATGLFDPQWYLQQNPDVAASGIDPFDHWLKYGVVERRNPNAYFDTARYLSNCPHLQRSGQNPLLHYLRRGAKQGLNPGLTFNTLEYVQRHPEVRKGNQNALVHCLQQEKRNGRLAPTRIAETPPVLNEKWRDGRQAIVFLGHDAHRAGAQLILLDIVRWMKERTRLDIRIVLGSGGDLVREYAKHGPVLVLDKLAHTVRTDSEVRQTIRKHCEENAKLVYSNTVACGRHLKHFEDLNVPILTHVHELEDSIRRYFEYDMAETIRCSNNYIAASPPVAANLIHNHSVSKGDIETIYEFIRPKMKPLDEVSKRDLRGQLGLPKNKVLVFGCGTVYWRKGPDIFVEVAAHLRRTGLSDFHFCWIGSGEAEAEKALCQQIKAANLDKHVTFLGPLGNPREWFPAGDLFLLPSREDPYPLVCLEAAECGMPIICFEDAGGMPDFVEADAGFMVPFEDAAAMAEKAATLISNSRLRGELGAIARRKLLDRHTTDRALREILSVIRHTGGIDPVVSVIVPCYNHAQFLQQRLDSIFNQTFQDFEVLLLDDCSSDTTPSILAQYAKHSNVQLITNNRNSGSTFHQWVKGIDKARADLVWIAEDDDFCDATFLEKMIPLFADPAVRLAYCQSTPVDSEGRRAGSYLQYAEELSSTKWKNDYVTSWEQEMNDGLAVKNTIPNASAVVFRKPNLAGFREDLQQYRFLGDWYFYLRASEGGRVAFIADVLNFHRRHDNTCIARFDRAGRHFDELRRLHRWVASTRQLDDRTRSMMRMHAERVWRACFPSLPMSDFVKQYSVQDVKPAAPASGCRRQRHRPCAQTQLPAQALRRPSP
jgi:glycosyltransferase involved in cell wall biosynthesis